MKTVTIPTCANPFVVIVNGIKYTYPAGATVEVPDDVAEVIEQHEEAKPEPAPVLPPFATGAVDDEVVDLSGVFDYFTSIAAGGEPQYVTYDGTAKIIEQCKRGAIIAKVSFAGNVIEQRIFAQVVEAENFVQFLTICPHDGDLLYIHTAIDGSRIEYSCKQVLTAPYIPS